MKVVGIGEVKSGEYNGYAYSHIPVFCEYEDRNVDGVGCTKINVPAKIGIGDLQLGDDIEVIYNRFGKIAGININE